MTADERKALEDRIAELLATEEACATAYKYLRALGWDTDRAHKVYQKRGWQ